MTNREIDALVAEHVMGAAVCRCDHAKTVSPRFDGQTGECLGCGKRIGGSYSTNPAASKQLRDRMRELGWSYTIKTFLLWDDPHFECVFYGLGLGLEESVGTSEETAVALAALAALGIEVAA